MSVTEARNAIISIMDSEGVPVFGMGSSDALDGQAAGFRPDDVLPGARSMLCFGIPVPRGVYGPGAHGTEMIWRTQNLFYRRMDELALRAAQLLEENGAQAAPIFGCCPMAVNERGQVQGYLNMIRMAEALGLGRIGGNGLLVHARFGSRLMLGGLVTTADLPPLERGAGAGKVCPEGCRACAEACPVRAISPARRRVNIMKCLTYTSRTRLLPRARFALLCHVKPESAAWLLNRTAFDEHSFHVCSRCIQVCPLGAETLE
jgi:epoxyqueuosine reductase QueG